MRVSFDGGRLNERGVSVALFDYAFHARAHLGIEPVILHDASIPPDPSHVARFAKEFPTYAYTSDEELQRAIEHERADVAYFLKTSRKDMRVSRSSRTAIHEVFKYYRPHGDVYAYISKWLSAEMSGGRCPVVPHIVDPPKPRANLRAGLGIPKDAFVVGRHGAFDQFNTPFVPQAILAALEKRKNLWFVFINTAPFGNHERIIHLPATADRQAIADFVGSCDIGINARRVGETFGLAIAEFLKQDKPVLVWEGGRDRNHRELVDDPRFVYRTRHDLARTLCDLEPQDWRGAWSARVAEFAPAPVIEAFAATFLSEESSGREAPPFWLPLRRSAIDRARRVRDRLWSAR
jgi:hypothetical protein